MELPYEEYTGACHILGSYFQGKIPKRACQGLYSVWKKFQIGSVILMTQMASQKKTELIDDFDLVWIIKPQNFGKMEAISPKTALKIVFWRPSLGTKIPKMVQVFRRKLQKWSM